ncbi:MAG: nucleotidyltransferase family protein [Candidatus Omnitrophica bacterium]|nr:nucleotidyltransferase family protein [Candidatus Omnitrophota bacterium]
MKAVFLCAGYGTRLYPLTEDRPKPLLPIAGEALLSHLLSKLDSVPSLEQVVVVSNDRFYGNFCDWKKTVKAKKPIVVIHDGTKDPETRLGAIGDLKLAVQETGNQDDILVIAGDNLFDSDFSSFVSFGESKKPAASLCVYDVQDRRLAAKYGLVKTDSRGKITDFLEKPKNPPTTLASMGFYYLPQESLTYLDQYLAENKNPDAPGFYIAWLSKRTDVYAFTFNGTWFDIGDLASYQKADTFYQNYLKKS